MTNFSLWNVINPELRTFCTEILEVSLTSTFPYSDIICKLCYKILLQRFLTCGRQHMTFTKGSPKTVRQPGR